ncbi:Protein-tyrosine-phosphatase [Altererythrobacter insulae]|nr:Protein-tyrosine-phosphatase [Altererythrobacter insulae]
MRGAAERAGLDVQIDSCGTAAYHIGSPPDPRSIETAAANGADISGLRGRQLRQEDFTEFDYIFAMDHQNLRNIQAIQPEGANAQVMLLMDMVSGREGAAIADPYYDGEEQFAYTWEDVSAAADAIIAELTAAQ